MKTTLLLLAITALSRFSFGQEKQRMNNVFFELGGNGLTLSFEL